MASDRIDTEKLADAVVQRLYEDEWLGVHEVCGLIKDLTIPFRRAQGTWPLPRGRSVGRRKADLEPAHSRALEEISGPRGRSPDRLRQGPPPVDTKGPLVAAGCLPKLVPWKANGLTRVAHLVPVFESCEVEV